MTQGQKVRKNEPCQTLYNIFNINRDGVVTLREF